MRCKLVTRNASRLQFLFLNAKGMGVVTFDRKDLASAMLRKRIRLLDQGPLIGRFLTWLAEFMGKTRTTQSTPLYNT